MSLAIPDGFGSVAIEYTATVGTGPFYVTFGTTVPAGVPLLDVANKVFNDWVATWEDGTFTEFVMVRSILTVPAPGGGLGSVVSDAPTAGGNAEGDPAVVAAAVLVNKNTSVIGRHGRGRFFIPGLLGESDIDANGNIAPSTVSLYQGQIDDWLELMQTPGAGWDGTTNPQLLHTDESVPPSAIGTFTVTNKVGILRKRLL